MKRENNKQQMCSENASLFTKLHNYPYITTHPKTFLLFHLLGAIKDAIIFFLFLFVAGLCLGDIVMLSRLISGG